MASISKAACIASESAPIRGMGQLSLVAPEINPNAFFSASPSRLMAVYLCALATPHRAEQVCVPHT